MEKNVLLFWTILGLSVLLGVCFAILKFPKQQNTQQITSFRKIGNVLRKLDSPALRIGITFLLVVLSFLCFWDMSLITQDVWERTFGTIANGAGVCCIAFVTYILCSPPYLRRKNIISDILVNDTSPKLYIISNSLGVVLFIVLSILTETMVVSTLSIAVIPLVFIPIFLMFVIIAIISVIILFIISILAGLVKVYWNWVLKQ